MVTQKMVAKWDDSQCILVEPARIDHYFCNLELTFQTTDISAEYLDLTDCATTMENTENSCIQDATDNGLRCFQGSHCTHVSDC
jgi:hypothetical protein